MRSDPAEYELVAPGTLSAVLLLLADQPGAWLPIAGGTDLMVQYSAGKLASKRLVSLWRLPELRRIDVSDDKVVIGAGCTYTDIREHHVLEREFPLLTAAARWTGGIANQNRGTLGGNIVNASPAADSLPALLAYEAELILISARGERRVRYADFHTGYKKTLLAPIELIRAIVIHRRFAGYVPYSRKVGARNAQAIAKVCIAALAHVNGGVVEDVRIAAGSVAPVPLRLIATERIVRGNPVDAPLISRAVRAAAGEIHPIDDIRSTAAYRSAVLRNLVAEFLNKLRVAQVRTTDTLAHWNALSAEQAANEILPCCGSHAWARALAARRPFHHKASLVAASDEIWRSLSPNEWSEAFATHPRIGERKAPPSASKRSADWSEQEQQRVGESDAAAQSALAAANQEYETRFHRTFILCATRKSVAEMLDILRHRLQNDDAAELRESAEEQRKITNIRLEKWLSQ